jgi:hypothetical protein
MIVKGFSVSKWLVSAIIVASPIPISAHEHTHGAKPEITVYKSPTCRCCTGWVEHLRKHGFKVIVKETADMDAIKSDLGVPRELGSCHTAIVGKYVIEGHVPAADIDRLLKTKPKIAGIAVPGMPAGSPGMEVGRTEKYDVVTFGPGQKSSVFARH